MRHREDNKTAFAILILLVIGLFAWNLAAESRITGYLTGTLGVIVQGEQPPEEEGVTTLPPSGRGEKLIKERFTVTSDIVEKILVQGRTGTFDLQIKSIYDRRQFVTIESQNLNNFVVINETSLMIEPYKTETVGISLFSLYFQKPGVYTGKLILSSGDFQKEVTVIIEIKEKQPLFSINISMQPECKHVFPDGRLKSLITLENTGGFRGQFVDVELQLAITDMDKIPVYELTRETVAVKTETALLKEIKVPADIAPGKYLLVGKISYHGLTTESYSIFYVDEEAVVEYAEKPPASLLALVAVIIVIVYFLYKKLAKPKHETRIPRQKPQNL